MILSLGCMWSLHSAQISTDFWCVGAHGVAVPGKKYYLTIIEYYCLAGAILSLLCVESHWKPIMTWQVGIIIIPILRKKKAQKLSLCHRMWWSKDWNLRLLQVHWAIYMTEIEYTQFCLFSGSFAHALLIFFFSNEKVSAY